LLTRRPACLLFDEPTNHPDDDAVAYLEQALRDLPGVVVVASHDRVFLDTVADQVLASMPHTSAATAPEGGVADSAPCTRDGSATCPRRWRSGRLRAARRRCTPRQPVRPRRHCQLQRPVGELSLGQQRRLALAVLVARQPDLVLLDEPTNHISLALADELEEALQRSVRT
jgi:ATPase subunit of ABC transporter with duplicated ATPase domains